MSHEKRNTFCRIYQLHFTMHAIRNTLWQRAYTSSMSHLNTRTQSSVVLSIVVLGVIMEEEELEIENNV